MPEVFFGVRTRPCQYLFSRTSATCRTHVLFHDRQHISTAICCGDQPESASIVNAGLVRNGYSKSRRSRGTEIGETQVGVQGPRSTQHDDCIPHRPNRRPKPVPLGQVRLETLDRDWVRQVSGPTDVSRRVPRAICSVSSVGHETGSGLGKWDFLGSVEMFRDPIEFSDNAEVASSILASPTRTAHRVIACGAGDAGGGRSSQSGPGLFEVQLHRGDTPPLLAAVTAELAPATAQTEARDHARSA